MKSRVTFALLMSFILSLLMTCWVTWINLGWNKEFYAQWLHAFVLAWPAAAMVAFIFSPIIQKLTLKITE